MSDHKYECDCGAVYNNINGLEACQLNNHGKPWPPSKELKKALEALDFAAAAIAVERDAAGFWSPDQRRAWLNSIEQKCREAMKSSVGYKSTGDQLLECARRANVFYNDVLPQIGGLALQDYGNLNDLGMLLRGLLGKDESRVYRR